MYNYNVTATLYHTDCTYFKNVIYGLLLLAIEIIMVKIALARRWRRRSVLYVFQERMDFCMDYYFG